MTISPIKSLKPITLRDCYSLPMEGWALLAYCGHMVANTNATVAQRRDASLGLVGCYSVISAWLIFPTMILAGAA